MLDRVLVCKSLGLLFVASLFFRWYVTGNMWLHLICTWLKEAVFSRDRFKTVLIPEETLLVLDLFLHTSHSPYAWTYSDQMQLLQKSLQMTLAAFNTCFKHLGVQYLAQGFLGSALKIFGCLSCYQPTFQFGPWWGLNYKPSSTKSVVEVSNLQNHVLDST